jgi:hypothetical protein
MDGAVPPREMAPSANAPAAAARQTTPLDGDSVAGLLRELAQTGLPGLPGILDGAPAPPEEAQAETLLQAVLAAVADESPGRALAQFRQLARLDPGRAEGLASGPALASIRPAVERLLSQLAVAAKLHAEGRLAEAARLWDSGAGKELPAREIRPETLLLIATRLLEAGGLANYVRSAAASGVLIDQSRWAPAPQAEPVPARESGGESRMPLRVLFLAWFALGMAGLTVCWCFQYDRPPAAFEVWGGGLVALACLGAWQRIRRS